MAADAKGLVYHHRKDGTNKTLLGLVKTWPTPTASDGKKGQTQPDGKRGQTLVGATRGQIWNTPTSCHRDLAGGSNSRASAKKRGTYIGGGLNPQFVEWLMGFPIGFTDLRDLVIPSFRPSRNGSAGA
jgi:hypothetical protein